MTAKEIIEIIKSTKTICENYARIGAEAGLDRSEELSQAQVAILECILANIGE